MRPRFNTHNIRVVTIEGQPWFVANDVCRCLHLSLESGGAIRHTKKLNADEKLTLTRKNSLSLFEGDTRAPSYSAISESGLYKLIMRSDKPEAKAFQDWVTQEVLPSIRKTGAYVTGQASLVENPQMSALELLHQQAQLLPQLVKQMIEMEHPRKWPLHAP